MQDNDATDHYQINYYNGLLKLWKVVDGQNYGGAPLATASFNWYFNTAYTLKAAAYGAGAIVISVNGTQYITVTDTTYKSGGMSLMSRWGTHHFDNVKVRGWSEARVADLLFDNFSQPTLSEVWQQTAGSWTLGTAPVGGSQTISNTTGEVTATLSAGDVSWTSPLTYEVKLMEHDSGKTTSDPATGMAGMRFSVQDDENYYQAALLSETVKLWKVQAGQATLLGSASLSAPTAWVFNTWRTLTLKATITGTITVLVDGSAKLNVTNETTFAKGGLALIGRVGTHYFDDLKVNGGGWEGGTKYEVAMRQERNTGSGIMGFRFRWQSPDNFYQFDLREGGTALLYSKVSGVWTQLGQGTFVWAPGWTYTATMVAEADGTLKGYVDGQLVVSVKDTTFSKGKLVLVSQSAAHRFGSVRVQSLALVPKPHALTHVNGQRTYQYDANGNMTSGAGRTIAWDAENRPITITLGSITTNFVYDADGKRVKKAETNGSTVTTTLYVGNYYEQVLVNGVLSETVKYYYAGSSRIAMRRTPTVGQQNLSYIFADHLGSTSVVSPTVGGQIDRITFFPFGGTRAGSVPTDNQFTGQKADSGTGLYYYSDGRSYGRFYDPQIGRWTQPDLLVQSLADPQFLNRFSYGRNNPIRYDDPEGHIIPLIIGGIFVGALVVSYLATAPGVGAPAPGQEGRMPHTAAQLAEQDRAVLGASGSDFTNGRWGTLALAAVNYVPGGKLFELRVAEKLLAGALITNRAGKALPKMEKMISGQYNNVHGIDLIGKEAETGQLWILEAGSGEFQKRLNNGQMSAKWRKDKIDLLLDNDKKLEELKQMTGIDDTEKLRAALYDAKVGVVIREGATIGGLTDSGLSGLEDIYRLAKSDWE